MTYLSPHVHRIVCEITEEGNAGCLKGDGGEICTANSDDLTVDGDEASKKKTFYLMYAKKLWHAPVNCHLNGSNQSEIIRAVKYSEWTGCAERILEWMKMPTEFTNLIILKLTVIIERSLGDIFVTITNKRCPSLLKDLLQTDALRRVFGEHLMTAFETLMGPPVSLNLRNVLWHGFPMLGEINSQYCTLLLDHIITSGKVLEEKQIGNIKHRPSLSIQNTDLIKDCFPSMNGREIVFKICKSTAFIPTGMAPAWKIALELFLSERYSDAVIIFLPQLEHALRCLFTIINCCPHRQITAESDVLYTTFDEVLCSTSEKRIQLENRTLRSRARNNYMNMLAVIPVLTSCWLSLLLIASIETLIFDGTNSPQVVKHLKKCLKYSENITTFSSPQHNKWLECLLAAEKLSEILEDRLKLITTENFIA